MIKRLLHHLSTVLFCSLAIAVIAGFGSYQIIKFYKEMTISIPRVISGLFLPEGLAIQGVTVKYDDRLKAVTLRPETIIFDLAHQPLRYEIRNLTAVRGMTLYDFLHLDRSKIEITTLDLNIRPRKAHQALKIPRILPYNDMSVQEKYESNNDHVMISNFSPQDLAQNIHKLFSPKIGAKIQNELKIHEIKVAIYNEERVKTGAMQATFDMKRTPTYSHMNLKVSNLLQINRSEKQITTAAPHTGLNLIQHADINYLADTKRQILELNAEINPGVVQVTSDVALKTRKTTPFRILWKADSNGETNALELSSQLKEALLAIANTQQKTTYVHDIKNLSLLFEKDATNTSDHKLYISAGCAAQMSGEIELNVTQQQTKELNTVIALTAENQQVEIYPAACQTDSSSEPKQEMEQPTLVTLNGAASLNARTKEINLHLENVQTNRQEKIEVKLDLKPQQNQTGNRVLLNKTNTQAPLLKISAQSKALSKQTILALWPEFFLPNIHDTLKHSISFRQIENLSYAAQLTDEDITKLKRKEKIANDKIDVEFTAKDLEWAIKDKLSPIKAQSAAVRIAGHELKITSSDAQYGSGQDVLKINNMTFANPNTSLEIPKVTMSARLSGTLAAHLNLAKIAEENTTSDRSTEQWTNIKLKKPLTADLMIKTELNTHIPKTEIDYKASLDGLEVENIMGKMLEIKTGTLEITHNQKSLNIKGTYNKKPVDAVWRADDKGNEDAVIETTLDLASYPELTGMIEGDTGLNVIITKQKGIYELIADADLTSASVILPLIETKPKGTKAALSFKATGNKSLSFDKGEWQYTKGEMRLRGGIGGLSTGTLNIQTQETHNTDLRSISYQADGSAQKVSLALNELDIKPYIKDIASQTSDTGKKIAISLNAKQVKGFNGQILEDMNLKATLSAGALEDLDLRASYQGKLMMAGQVIRGEGQPYLYITSSKPGVLLRFLDIYEHVEGGQLKYSEILVPKGQPSSGVLFLEQFHIQGDEGLQRLSGSLKDQRTQQLQSAYFNKLRLEFIKNGARYDIRNSMLKGPTIGLSFKGQVDFDQNAIDITGTFFPAYTLNAMLTKVPVLGQIIGGGEDKGVLGVTYAIRGYLDAPKLRINPVSAVAPGFVRELFQFEHKELPTEDIAPAQSPLIEQPAEQSTTNINDQQNQKANTGEATKNSVKITDPNPKYQSRTKSTPLNLNNM